MSHTKLLFLDSDIRKLWYVGRSVSSALWAHEFWRGKSQKVDARPDKYALWKD